MSDYELIVGESSYVTIGEADAYVTAHFLSDDAQRVTWETLSDGDKSIYLRRAIQAIESVKWAGEKSEASQQLCFPRRWHGVYQNDDLSICYAQKNDGNVKAAQIEEAVERACPTAASERKERLVDRLSEIQIGHLKEVYGSKHITGNYLLADVFQSIQAQELMQKYAGSFEVR